MLNLLVMLLWAAGGFALGLVVLGGVPSLRERPRYLMALGAVVMPLIFVAHLFIPIRGHLFGPDLLFMMTGVGMIVAGWDSEIELEARIADERRRRLRVEWEQRSADVKEGEASNAPPSQ